MDPVAPSGASNALVSYPHSAPAQQPQTGPGPGAPEKDSVHLLGAPQRSGLLTASEFVRLEMTRRKGLLRVADEIENAPNFYEAHQIFTALRALEGLEGSSEANAVLKALFSHIKYGPHCADDKLKEMEEILKSHPAGNPANQKLLIAVYDKRRDQRESMARRPSSVA